MWTQIRLLVHEGEQPALDLHCLFKRLHNISIDDKNIRLCCNIRFKG